MPRLGQQGRSKEEARILPKWADLEWGAAHRPGHPQAAASIWISDQTSDANVVRFHLRELDHFLPSRTARTDFGPAGLSKCPG